MRKGLVVRNGVVLACALSLCSQVALAQQISGIAGLVTDSSGAVLPGVTVEAESPALIERVRTGVTGDEGRYNIVNLRPGTYVVTFTLSGFRPVRREGIELTAGFTAPVNVDLEVGALEETITVTGASPLIDVQNVNQQEVVTGELFSTLLPSGQQALGSIARLIPGMSGGLDGGGAVGMYRSNTVSSAQVHGKQAAKMSYDGMQTEGLAFFGYMNYVMNPGTVEEFVVDQGGSSAESDVSGLRLNLIPKEGGNVFSTVVSGMYSHEDMHSANLNDRSRESGIMTTAKIRYMYDANGTVGGPIKRDSVWFMVNTRFAGMERLNPGLYFNATQGTPLYTPDFDRPSYTHDVLKSVGGRITWQASPRNKLSAYADTQSFLWRGSGSNRAPEAAEAQNHTPNGVYQATWVAPVSNQFLIEAGWSFADVGTSYHLGNTTDVYGFTVKPTDVYTREASTGFQYNAKNRYREGSNNNRFVERFSITYVTGTHAFKTGFTMQHHVLEQDTTINNDRYYTFLRGKPTSITLWAQPFFQDLRTNAELGLYAQDKWTIDRLTLNYGLRFDYFNGYVKATDLGAGQFVGARSFPEVNCAPCWSDINPRLGASYDLSGDGRTALKTSFGRYVGKHSTTVQQLLAPVSSSVSNARRSWNDIDEDFEPDCDLNNPALNGECGPISNINFGQANPNATTYDDDVTEGWHNRDYYWDFTAELQHQLSDAVSIAFSYNRNWTDYFGETGIVAGGPFGLGPTTRDNLALTPEDYDPYCITAPSDPRLPGGGGYEVCGLYDVKPGVFGSGVTAVRRPEHYDNVNGGTGKSTTRDFFTITVDSRFGSGIQVGGSVDTGRTIVDNCFVVDTPQQLLNCRFTKPFNGQTQIKAHGVVPLPRGFTVSGVFQSLSGATFNANYRVSNDEIAPSLGRNLAACGTRAVCTASVSVPLVEPQTFFEPRLQLLDVRFSKMFELVSQGGRLRASVDIFNILNSGAATNVNSNYGSRWQRVNSLVPGRLIQLSGELRF